MFLNEEIILKTIEREKIIRELQKIKNDLRTVMKFIDWTHISNEFTESNIKAIKRVEEVQNHKLSELMGTKLQHDPEKVIYNFSSYDLTQTEITLLLLYHRRSLNLRITFSLLNCCIEML